MLVDIRMADHEAAYRRAQLSRLYPKRQRIDERDQSVLYANPQRPAVKAWPAWLSR